VLVVGISGGALAILNNRISIRTTCSTCVTGKIPHDGGSAVEGICGVLLGKCDVWLVVGGLDRLGF